METIPECWYRVSIKALVLNETRNKFLVCLEDDGQWELPGGGLDWGMTPQEDLPREISEEMGLSVRAIARHPSYFVTFNDPLGGRNHPGWRANVVYEAELEHLEFTPSAECLEIRFVDKDDLIGLKTRANITQLAELFDPNKHQEPL